MGFYPQPNAWQCGPFALKYALLVLAIPSHERTLTRASGATEHGADERDLDRAARRYGCVLAVERWRDAGQARHALHAHLASGTPVLLCVEEWSHWMVAVAVDTDAVVVLDSRVPNVFGSVPLAELMERVAYHPNRWRVLYDLHPLMSGSVPRARATFSRARVEMLCQPGNLDLRRRWDEYLRVLLPVSRPPRQQAEWTVALAGLVREAIPRVLGETAEDRVPLVQRRLAHACFVAETYGLEIGPDETDRVVSAVHRFVDRVAAAA